MKFAANCEADARPRAVTSWHARFRRKLCSRKRAEASDCRCRIVLLVRASRPGATVRVLSVVAVSERPRFDLISAQQTYCDRR
jgi:hypothetical protein